MSPYRNITLFKSVLVDTSILVAEMAARRQRFLNERFEISSSQCPHYFRSSGTKLPCLEKCLVKIEFCEVCEKKIYLCRICGFGRCMEKKVSNENSIQEKSWDSKRKWLVGIVLLVSSLCLLRLRFGGKNYDIIENLRREFPSQENRTWYNILSALEMENPTVKTITLLHGENKSTVLCLIKKIIVIFGKDLKIEDITFKHIPEAKDYGEVLEYYLPVVKEHRVLLTDLNQVPAKVARIFHSLCDELSSDIKPSLFIFTLKCDNCDRNFKTVERATSTLKKIWKDLTESDFFPLLSRIVRTVVNVIPEKEIIC